MRGFVQMRLQIATFVLTVLCCLQGLQGLSFDCDFERLCQWRIQNGFVLSSTENATFFKQRNLVPPVVDGSKDPRGHFVLTQSTDFSLTLSNIPAPVKEKCTLSLDVFQGNFTEGHFSVVLTDKEHSKFMYSVATNLISVKSRWLSHKVKLAPQSKSFNLTIEIHRSAAGPTNISSLNRKPKTYFAIDNARLDKCFDAVVENCDATQHRCKGTSGNTTICVSANKLCDFEQDCPQGDDETLSICDNMPHFSRCNFNNKTMCGWLASTDLDPWNFPPHNVSAPQNRYFCSKHPLQKDRFKPVPLITSPPLPRIPYYHSNVASAYYQSCQLRFSYFRPKDLGKDNIIINLKESDPRYPDGREIEFWPSKNGRAVARENWNRGWLNVKVPLPTMVRFEYRISIYGQHIQNKRECVGFDEISFTPECYGLGVPENETREYPAYLMHDADSERTHSGNISLKYEFDNCGANGPKGPSDEQCQRSYNHLLKKVVTVDKGIQVWQVPETGIYTIFAVGASGGFGLRNTGSNKGAYVRATFRLKKKEKLHILVGQKGRSACDEYPPLFKETCLHYSGKQKRSAIQSLQRTVRAELQGAGGGGGGATFVFREKENENVSYSNFIPLLVAAGGGGMAATKTSNQDPVYSVGDIFYEDGDFNTNDDVMSDAVNGAGAGGGWLPENITTPVDGRSLLEGAEGGIPCANKLKQWKPYGGFGGGGGACLGGGGGGGWKGGRASPSGKIRNGAGGTSFVFRKETIDRPSVLNGLQQPAYLKYFRGRDINKPKEDTGDGFVIVVPSKDIECPCPEICIPVWLATRASTPKNPSLNPMFRCACNDSSKVISRFDNKTCVHPEYEHAITELRMSPSGFFILSFALLVLVVFGFGVFFIFGFIRCPLRKNDRESQLLGRRDHSSAELQLSRLRQQTGMVTEYNPNYEFGGSTCTLHDLQEIPRESLTLCRPLGQGAFGEVYQGLLTRYNGDLSELSVAVKTLPELSTADSEKDFITEACIMSKFNHPNIVSFIGVCFDRMPRFIVLELLAGGDLKSFLRESRPKTNRPSQLNMTDLLLLAVDVAKGCQYLEEKRFIHRDIAARNCLLTSKLLPERKVKIADFGMARDIYRADYYRKGGKAMLPVKWMPPEAFLDGLFTSKTDVWSFGVLLWEVMSMGYMPYPGRGNQEVMQLVTSGGRLEPPINCPGPVYHIMTQCWSPIPEDRPCFSTILERLGYCLQDPDVTSTELPMFQRAPSVERERASLSPRNSKEQLLNEKAEPHALEPTPAVPMDDYMIPMGQYAANDCRRRQHYSGTPLSPLTPETAYPQLAISEQLSPTFPAPPPPRQIDNWKRSGLPSVQPEQSTYRSMDDGELPILEPLMSSQNQLINKKPYANVRLDRSRIDSQTNPDSFGEISC